MSLGSVGSCHQAYVDAVAAIVGKTDPAVIVASAGNSTGHAVSAPANCPGVIGVAAVRHVGTKVGFSDLGPEITLSAPGGNCVNTGAGAPCLYPILAATNTGLTRPLASSYSDAFKPSLGTSFSAPLVAGTVALMLSVQPALTPAEVATLLKRSARAFPFVPANSTVPLCKAPETADQLECHCTTATCGAGMLDVAAAVASAMANVAQVRLEFASGWNLSGNATTQAIAMATTFDNAATVESVWKWNAAQARWAFYSPMLQTQALAEYAATAGYEVLTTVSGGEGYWLKAKQGFSVDVAAGEPVPATSVTATLQPGWNLVTTAVSLSPAALSAGWGGVTSLWAWNNALSRWYFYAPSLEGGSALVDYIAANGYLDFSASGKTLGPGTGFWVRKP
jgi:serine protease